MRHRVFGVAVTFDFIFILRYTYTLDLIHICLKQIYIKFLTIIFYDNYKRPQQI